jgi:hypothetical protein
MAEVGENAGWTTGPARMRDACLTRGSRRTCAWRRAHVRFPDLVRKPDGRVRPFPRKPVRLDGLGVGHRSTDGDLEVGAFAAALPDLVTLEPTTSRYTAGACSFLPAFIGAP